MNTSRIFNRVLIAAMIVFVGSASVMNASEHGIQTMPAIYEKKLQVARILGPMVVDLLMMTMPDNQHPIIQHGIVPLTKACVATCFKSTQKFVSNSEQVNGYFLAPSRHSQKVYLFSQFLTRVSETFVGAQMQVNVRNFGSFCNERVYHGMGDVVEGFGAPSFIGWIHDWIADWVSRMIYCVKSN